MASAQQRSRALAASMPAIPDIEEDAAGAPERHFARSASETTLSELRSGSAPVFRDDEDGGSVQVVPPATVSAARLVWLFFRDPVQLRAVQMTYGEDALRQPISWMVSTCVWLPVALFYLVVDALAPSRSVMRDSGLADVLPVGPALFWTTLVGGWLCTALLGFVPALRPRPIRFPFALACAFLGFVAVDSIAAFATSLGRGCFVMATLLFFNGLSSGASRVVHSLSALVSMALAVLSILTVTFVTVGNYTGGVETAVALGSTTAIAIGAWVVLHLAIGYDREVRDALAATALTFAFFITFTTAFVRSRRLFPYQFGSAVLLLVIACVSFAIGFAAADRSTLVIVPQRRQERMQRRQQRLEELQRERDHMLGHEHDHDGDGPELSTH